MRPIDPESLMGLDAIPPAASCVQPVIEELGHYCVGGSPYVNIDVSGTTTWKALTLDGVQTMECQEDQAYLSF